MDYTNEYGAVLLRGFDVNSAIEFEQAIKVLNKDLENYQGGDSPRKKVSEYVYTSTSYPSNESISMHQEKSYSKSYPRYIYFYCEIEPTIGGETPIADARVIFRRMPNEILNILSKKKLKYVMNMPSQSGIGKTWQEVFETESQDVLENMLSKQSINYQWKHNGKILKVYEVVDPIIVHPKTGEQIFFSQAHQWHKSALDNETLEDILSVISSEDLYHNCYYGDGSEIEPEILIAMRSVIKDCSVKFKWRKGDLLILDNIISMHGREPFQGKRRILVGMSQ